MTGRSNLAGPSVRRSRSALRDGSRRWLREEMQPVSTLFDDAITQFNYIHSPLLISYFEETTSQQFLPTTYNARLDAYQHTKRQLAAPCQERPPQTLIAGSFSHQWPSVYIWWRNPTPSACRRQSRHRCIRRKYVPLHPAITVLLNQPPIFTTFRLNRPRNESYTRCSQPACWYSISCH